MRTVAVLLAASLLAAAQAHAEGPATDAAPAAKPVHRKPVAKPAASTVKAAPSPASTPAPKPIAPPAPVATAPLPPVGAGGAVSAPVTVTAQRQPLTDWRPLDAENALVIDTGKGRIVVELRPEVAPLAVARVKRLARSHVYDGLLFHRVVEGFVAQTGNPDNMDGGKSLEPNLPAEFTFRLGAEVPRTIAARPQGESEGFIGAQPYVSVDEQRMAMSPDRRVSAWGAYCAGVMGMGHDADPDSGNSELFFMRETTRSLDRHYSPVGRVVLGLEVIRALPVGDPPAAPDRMLRVRVMADLPDAERPAIFVLNTLSPQFWGLVAQARQGRGADFSICDVDVPVRVVSSGAAGPADKAPARRKPRRPGPAPA